MSGSAPPRKRLSAADRRARVLHAATEQFAIHGYRGASLRVIATNAGITTPVVYEHFASKSDLYAAVAQAQADQLLARWSTPPPGSPHDIFRATVDALFSWVEEHPDGWRVLFADPPTDPIVAARFSAIQDRATAAVAELFAAFPSLDLPPGLPRELADAAYAEAAKSAVNGLATWWWNNRDVPRETVVALAGDLLWRGLRDVTKTD